MATPNFKIQVEQFLRRIGQGNVVITYVANAPVFTPALNKVSESQIYDYYQFAGQQLFRAIEKFSKGQTNKMFPTFFKVVSAATAAAGVYTFTEAIERVIEPLTVWTNASPDKKPCYQIPDGILELCLNSIGIRAISTDYPGFYIRDNAINILPTSKDRLTFSYVQSVPRIQLTDHATTYKDIWTANFGSMLVDGMVMIQKGDTGDVSLQAYYYNQLQNSYKTQALPITNQNNSLTEQV